MPGAVPEGSSPHWWTKPIKLPAVVEVAVKWRDRQLEHAKGRNKAGEWVGSAGWAIQHRVDAEKVAFG